MFFYASAMLRQIECESTDNLSIMDLSISVETIKIEQQ